ncbi:FRG domain-containing protein [Siphonobacter sp.]|uniref:FRG domain-containing protein n=1 Tax=Siphonobacter sp. TaxID=1869184 RepID=UPI003B3B405E
MKEVELSTIEAYLTLIKQSKDEHSRQGYSIDFLFRGQTFDHPLLPKICRLKAKGDILQVEQTLLQEFKRTNPLLIEPHRPMDDWDYLTLGQHFTLPTRLLDWSNNALTALWFATGESLVASSYSVVWILMAQEEDFAANLETMHPFDVPQTKLVRPRIIKQRINNQSGVFSVASSQELLTKQYMNEIDSYTEKLIKVKIPSTCLKQIRTDLDTLGVNAFSIFPELEGLCTYLQWRYFE